MRYDAKWKEYRRRRTQFWVIFLSYLPGAGFIGILLEKIIGTEAPFYIVAGIWMILFAVTGLRLTYWKCPRCNKSFFVNLGKFMMINQFARKCLNCGLQKWSSGE